MLAKAFFLAALIIFVVMALSAGTVALSWVGFACMAAGLLVDGFGALRL